MPLKGLRIVKNNKNDSRFKGIKFELIKQPTNLITKVCRPALLLFYKQVFGLKKKVYGHPDFPAGQWLHSGSERMGLQFRKW